MYQHALTCRGNNTKQITWKFIDFCNTCTCFTEIKQNTFFIFFQKRTCTIVSYTVSWYWSRSSIQDEFISEKRFDNNGFKSHVNVSGDENFFYEWIYWSYVIMSILIILRTLYILYLWNYTSSSILIYISLICSVPVQIVVCVQCFFYVLIWFMLY